MSDDFGLANFEGNPDDFMTSKSNDEARCGETVPFVACKLLFQIASSLFFIIGEKFLRYSNVGKLLDLHDGRN